MRKPGFSFAIAVALSLAFASCAYAAEGEGPSGFDTAPAPVEAVVPADPDAGGAPAALPQAVSEGGWETSDASLQTETAAAPHGALTASAEISAPSDPAGASGTGDLAASTTSSEGASAGADAADAAEGAAGSTDSSSVEGAEVEAALDAEPASDAQAAEAEDVLGALASGADDLAVAIDPDSFVLPDVPDDPDEPDDPVEEPDEPDDPVFDPEAERVEDGAYTIQSGLGTYLDVEGSSTENGANVDSYSENYSAAQRFYIEGAGQDGTGEWYYTIENVNSGKVVECESGGTSPGTNVQLYDYNGSGAQLWYIRTLPDGTSMLVNKASGLVLDIVGASAAPGANVQVYTANGSAAQKWILRRCVAVIEDGAYVVESVLPGGYVVDVDGASGSATATIQLYGGNGSNAQAFALNYDEATGYYVMTNYGSGLAVDVVGASTAEGATLNQYYANSSSAQLWQVIKNADGTYTFRSAINGLVIDVDSGLAYDGARLQLWSSNGSASQRFALRSTVPTVSADFAVIRNGGNGYLVMDVEGGSRNEGAALQIAGANGGFAQKYKIVSNGDGTYSFQGIGSGLYVTVEGDGTVVLGSAAGQGGESGAAVAAANQRWTIAPTATGHFAFVLADGSGMMLGALGLAEGSNLAIAAGGSALFSWNLIATQLLENGYYTFSLAANESLVLDVDGASFDAGANVQFWGSNGSNAQKFYVRLVEDGVYEISNAWSLLNLDVLNSVAAAGANVQQWTSNDLPAQRWIVEWNGAGGFVLRSALGQFALASTGTAQGSNAQLAAYDPTNSLQVLYLTPTTFAAIGFSERIAVLDAAPGDGINAFRSMKGLSAQTVADLQAIIDRYHSAGADVGFALIDLNTGAGVTYNADGYFYSASTIKGPYVISLNKYWPWELQYWSATMWQTIDISSNEAYATLRNVFGSEPLKMLIDETHAWNFDYTPYYVNYTARDLSKLWVGMADYLMSDAENAAWCRDVFDSNGSITSRSALSWKGCTVYAKSGWVTGMSHNEGCLVMDGDNPYVMVVMSTDNWMYPQRMYDLMNVLDRAHGELIA